MAGCIPGQASVTPRGQAAQRPACVLHNSVRAPGPDASYHPTPTPGEPQGPRSPIPLAQPRSLEAILRAWVPWSWKMPARVMDKNRRPHTRHMVPGPALSRAQRLLVRPVLPWRGVGGDGTPSQQNHNTLTHTHVCTHIHTATLKHAHDHTRTNMHPHIYHFTHSDTRTPPYPKLLVPEPIM